MVMRAILRVALGAFLYGGVIRAEDSPKLPGSEMKTGDTALRCHVLFIAEVKSVSAPTLLGASQPGVSSYLANVVVSQQWIGTVNPKISVTLYTYDIARPNDYRGDLYERPPQVGSSYLIFADGLNGEFTTSKILPATDDNIFTVKGMLTDAFGSSQHGEWNKLAGSSLKVNTAISKSDVIFIAEVTALGSEVPQPPDAGYAGPLLKGVKAKVSRILRGSIGDQTSLSLFVDTVGGEKLPEVGQSYVFFVQTKGESAQAYPYDCLEHADAGILAIKILSATSENAAIVKRLIPN